MRGFVVKDSKGRSPFWYAVYVAADGRRLKKSTGLTSKSKALEIARTLQRAADEARRGVLTETRTRDLLSEILETVTGERLRFFSVAEWFEHFVAGKHKSRSSSTAARHEQLKREFILFLGNRSKLNIAAITSRDIAAFRDRRYRQGLAPVSVNHDIVVISSAFNAALRQGHIPFNPCLAVEPLRNRSQRKEVFTPTQVSALLKVAPGDWRGLIMVGFYTGQRLSDCANLQWKHIDLVSEIKTMRFETRKTGAVVLSVIHPVLEDFLLSLPTAESDEAFLFGSVAQRSTTQLSKAFRKILEAARIEEKIIHLRTGSGRKVFALSFHSLRHSFSSILANAGVSEERRMALTGHTTRSVHQHYTHHELQQLRDAVALLPRV